MTDLLLKPVGLTWTRSEEPFVGNNIKYKGDNYVNFVPSIGYRRHAKQNVMWRISLTPDANKYTFVPWLGASIGKKF